MTTQTTEEFHARYDRILKALECYAAALDVVSDAPYITLEASDLDWFRTGVLCTPEAANLLSLASSQTKVELEAHGLNLRFPKTAFERNLVAYRNASRTVPEPLTDWAYDIERDEYTKDGVVLSLASGADDRWTFHIDDLGVSGSGAPLDLVVRRALRISGAFASDAPCPEAEPPHWGELTQYLVGTRPAWLQDNSEIIEIEDTQGRRHELSVGAVSWRWVAGFRREFDRPVYSVWPSGAVCPVYPGTYIEGVRHDGTLSQGLSHTLPTAGEGRLTYVGYRILRQNETAS